MCTIVREGESVSVSDCKRERESVSSSRAHSVPDDVADNEADSVAEHNNRVEQSRAEHNSSDGIQEAQTLGVKVSLTLTVRTTPYLYTKLFKTRYQVLSCSQIEEQLDTWYRVKVLKGINSIPGIELGYIYSCIQPNSIPSIELGYIYA